MLSSCFCIALFASIGFPPGAMIPSLLQVHSVSIGFVMNENRSGDGELTELISLSREIHGQSEPTDSVDCTVRNGWMDGGWTRNTFPLGSSSQANHDG
jgi:hypothetical protein